MRTPTFEKENLKPIFLFFIFGCLCRKFCHANVDSREQQAILLKKWKKTSCQNCACFLFCRRRKNWHDFVTPFSTLANIKGSLPTNSTTPDRLRLGIAGATDRWRFSWFFCFNIAKKIFFSRPLCNRNLYLVLICTPTEAHSRIFVTGGQYSYTFWASFLLFFFSGEFPKKPSRKNSVSERKRENPPLFWRFFV